MTTLRGSGPAPHGYVRCVTPDCASEGPHYHPQRHPELVPAEPHPVADPRPGFYYVSVQNNEGKHALVRGPWRTHSAALEAVPVVRARCERLEPRACWWAFGTARSETDLGPGLLGAPEESGSPWASDHGW